MLEDIPHQCPFIKDHVMDNSLSLVLKDLQLLHLTLWLLRDVCCADKDSLPQSVRQWSGQVKHLQQKLTSNAEKNQLAGVFERMYQRMHFCP